MGSGRNYVARALRILGVEVAALHNRRLAVGRRRMPVVPRRRNPVVGDTRADVEGVQDDAAADDSAAADDQDIPAVAGRHNHSAVGHHSHSAEERHIHFEVAHHADVEEDHILVAAHHTLAVGQAAALHKLLEGWVHSLAAGDSLEEVGSNSFVYGEVIAGKQDGL